MKKIFYQPEGAFLGDVIPFYENGRFYLYYLHDRRNSSRYIDTVPWKLITTTDFVNFEEHGAALEPGGDDDIDRSCYTGSIFKEDNNSYHMFYTGHNAVNAKFFHAGRPRQAIIHATSKDLVHWTKHMDETFCSDDTIYEPWDWRDPFVYFNENDKRYYMLLAARRKNSSPKRGGCTAMCVSEDLKSWKAVEPFYEPEKYFTHECPDLFRMGNWWYQVFSTFSDVFATHYRMSKSLHGPWIAPVSDTFDTRCFYAAKTACDGDKRYIFGWIPTKKDDSDMGCWEWGGKMIAHEAVQLENGLLGCKLPESIYGVFKKDHACRLVRKKGNVVIAAEDIVLSSTDKASFAVFDNIPSQCLLEAKIKFAKSTGSFGIGLKMDDSLDRGYFITFEPFYNRIVFEMWPRYHYDTYYNITMQPRLIELERPFDMKGTDEISVKLILEDDICVMYVNDRTALSSRIYNNTSDLLTLFASDGEITVSGLKIKTIE